jgi:hypothetical protein
MRILIVVSALALAAVLWATSSIGRHIYKTRRRSRFLRKRRPQSWADPVSAPLIPLRQMSPMAVEVPSDLSPEVFSVLPEFEELLPALTVVEAAEQPATTFSKLAVDTFDNQPRKQPYSVEPQPTEALGAPVFHPDTFLRRPVRSVYPQAPATPFALPIRRPDWAYFNKDMGDLSDPSPSRVRDRVRSR